MTYDQLIGEVQNRARLSSRGDAERATEATLQTLADRLEGGESQQLVAELPEELKGRIRVDGHHEAERLSLDDFFARVSEREGADLPEAVHHARAVISVLEEAISPGEIADIRQQLPGEFTPLFESSSEGRMRV